MSTHRLKKTAMKKKILFVLLLISLSVKAQVEFYGATSLGGVSNIGTLFKTDSSGTVQTLVHDFFKESIGEKPRGSGLCLASNGKLYGLTTTGGAWISGYGRGVLFELDTINNIYSEKYIFNLADGGKPSGAMISAANGKLYGTTVEGGASGYGVIFEYDPITNIYLKKFDFPTLTAPGNNPSGALVETAPGIFYGMTTYGGVSNSGVIYEYDMNTNIYSKKADIAPLAGTPLGGLCLASDGLLYGITKYGGVAGSGLLISYTIGSASVNVVGDFYSGPFSVTPAAGVIQANNGKIYGMTYNGGIYSVGSIYSYNIASGLMSTEFSFSSTPYPTALLLEGINGKLYTDSPGALIEFDTASSVATVIHNFSVEYYGHTNSMLQLPGGRLYGMTDGDSPGGGTYYNGGHLYEYDLSTNICQKRVSFGVSRMGSSPNAQMVRADDGLLYGTTQLGGINNMGVLFNIDVYSGAYTVVRELAADTTGGNPRQGLLKAVNGKLYGVTQTGGSLGGGTLFEFDPANNSFRIVFNFSNSSFGNAAKSYLIQASNGRIYGSTQYGGAGGYGCIFEFDPLLNTVVDVYDFDSGTTGTGRAAVGGLIESSANGKLYGLTSEGGTAGKGVIYEFDPVSYTYVKKHDFSYGKQPMERMVEAVNGKMYGMTLLGGFSNYGTLFEYDPITSIFVHKYEYSGTANGAYPYSSLINGPDNLLYGVTQYGGAVSRGTIFSYDPILNSYNVKYSFNVGEGSSPENGLTNVCASPFPILTASNPYLCPGDSVLIMSGGSSGTTFQWNYNGSPISGAIDSSYYALAGGIYSLIESTPGGCSNESSSVTIFSQIDCDTWPGDADNDSIVDNNDLLTIGLYYGQTGIARTSGISNLWQAWPSTDWGTAQSNGQDIKHADCNGDGMVDNNDTLAINTNFSLTHAFAPSVNNNRSTVPSIYIVTSSSFYLPGDWVDAEIWLGTGSVPVSNLYGIAFNIDYDGALVQPGSEALTYPNSWLGSASNSIKISKIDGITSTALGAEARITHTNANGFGKIADFKFQLRNTISVADSLDLSVSYYNAIDSSGNSVLFNTQDLTLSIPVGINEHEVENQIKIFPNPYLEQTQISYSLRSESKVLIEVYDPIGRKIETLANSTQPKGEYSIPFIAKSNNGGIYFVKITINGRSITKRIVEIR